jgi:hypothetical protein
MTPALAIKHEISEFDTEPSIFGVNADLGASVSTNINSVPKIVKERDANLNLTATVLYTDEEGSIDTSEHSATGIENILNRMQEVSLQAAQGNDDHTDRAGLPTEMEAMFIEAQLIRQLVTRLNNNG